jgi:hypothetical protein
MKEVEQVFLEEFGLHPLDLFREFERVPMAAASLAQVHRGKRIIDVCRENVFFFSFSVVKPTPKILTAPPFVSMHSCDEGREARSSKGSIQQRVPPLQM